MASRRMSECCGIAPRTWANYYANERILMFIVMLDGRSSLWFAKIKMARKSPRITETDATVIKSRMVPILVGPE